MQTRTCLYKGNVATSYVKRSNKMYCLKLNWYCKGLNITEVAHDNLASVKSYIVEDLQPWFPELSEKSEE